MTKLQYLQLQALSKPLMQWLLNNCHPHTTIIMDSQNTEVVEGVAVVQSQEPYKETNPDILNH